LWHRLQVHLQYPSGILFTEELLVKVGIGLLDDLFKFKLRDIKIMRLNDLLVHFFIHKRRENISNVVADRNSGMKIMRLAFLSIMVIATTMLLQGCVVGQSIDMSDPDAGGVVNSQAYRQNLVVKDLRPYVVSGKKAPYFIGKYRAGLGIPYDVSTDGDVPLSRVLHSDLSLRPDQQSFPIKYLHGRVDIKDWNFDAYQNGKFTYHLEVLVSDEQGQKVDSETLKEEIGVTGRFWTGGKGGFERDMPGIYEKIVSRLVSDDSAIGSAARTLHSSSVPAP
jgi:hypothetical protein